MNHKRLFIILLLVVSSFIILSNLPVESAQIEKGEEAPNFSLYDIDGKKATLSSFRDNKVVLLDFGASWCSACIKGISAMNKLNREYKDKGLVILGIDIKESKEKVFSLINRYHISYTMLLDSDGKIAHKYSVRGIPFLVLIDKEGKVFWMGHLIDEEAKNLIDKHINHVVIKIKLQ